MHVEIAFDADLRKIGTVIDVPDEVQAATMIREGRARRVPATGPKPGKSAPKPDRAASET
ncbi:hypothetical protein [Saccharopolyspora rosea]|uniref:hypothetical protein n=1 Tax=Saccharopolyspora rosea TaxID=524884 RepID=UPI0021DB2A7F|nr:hypothetical protein [Saccharopolyspora rosea]